MVDSLDKLFDIDDLIIKLPLKYNPKFKKDLEYSYTNKERKMNCRKVLLSSSYGYCMYLYEKIIDKEKIEDLENLKIKQPSLEHSIEQKNFTATGLKSPVNCKYNLSIASTYFNEVIKHHTKMKNIETGKYNCPSNLECNLICNILKEDLQKSSELNDVLLMPRSSYYEMNELIFDIKTFSFLEPENYKNLSYKEIELVNKHLSKLELYDSSLGESLKKTLENLYKKQNPRECLQEILEGKRTKNLLEEITFLYLYRFEDDEIQGKLSRILNKKSNFKVEIKAQNEMIMKLKRSLGAVEDEDRKEIIKILSKNRIEILKELDS